MVADLTKEEIEVARTPIDLYAWCIGKIEHLATQGEAESLRLRRGLYKPLLEEVYPLGVWARNSTHLSSNATITPILGSQRFDAIIDDPLANPTTYHLEITQAHMGQSEHFRMLHINAHGWAPGPLSEMRREGDEVIPGRIMDTREGRILRTEQLIAAAIQRKLQNTYDPPIDLIVTFEDHGLDEEQNIAQRFRDLALQSIGDVAHPFRRIFLCGMSSRLNVSIDVDAQ